MPPPSFDRQRELRGDEQNKSYRREKLVLQRVEHLYQAGEPRYLLRRRLSVRVKFASKSRQHRRGESLLLQSPQDFREQRQLASGPLDFRHHAPDLRAV